MLRLKMVRLGRAVTLGVREKGAWTMSARIESSELGGVDRGWASRGEQGSLVTKVLRARRKLPSRYTAPEEDLCQRPHCRVGREARSNG